MCIRDSKMTLCMERGGRMRPPLRELCQNPKKGGVAESRRVNIWSFCWGQDALDLVEMVDIMSSHHAHDVFDGFLAALGMLAMVLPLLGRKRFQKREICLTQASMDLDRLPRIALLVVSGHDPFILILSLIHI